jgi:site-specific recombinase XerC
LGVPPPLHDLRHTFCSNLVLSGADLKDVKEMIGHADIGMTDRYSHLTAQHKLLMQRQLTNPHACQGAGTLTLTKHTNDFDTDTDTD